MARRFAVLFVVLVALPGCTQRLNIEKSLTLTPGDIEEPALVDAPRGQQKIRVEVNASEPIDVDVAIDDNRAAVKDALRLGKRPDAAKVLGSKQGAKTETFEATIPAGKAYTIILSGAKKKSEVKLKVISI